VADASVLIDIIGRDRVSSALRSAGKSADSTAGKMDNIHRKAALVGAALGGMALAAGKALYGMAKNAAEDEKSQALLARTLQNTTGATRKQVEQTESWISKMAQATGVTDDKLRPAMMKLVGATHDTSKAQGLLKKALDISAATGKPVEQVSLALAKAYNGQVSGLSRLGVKVQDSVKDSDALRKAQLGVEKAQRDVTRAIEAHGAHSDQAKDAMGRLEQAQLKLGESQGKTKKTTIDFSEAMDRIDKQFGGASATAADTYEGRMARLKNSFDESKEAIGARLLPIMTNLAGWILETGVPALDKFGDFLDRNRKIIVPLVGVISGLAVAVYAINTAAKIYTATQAALNIVLTNNPVGRVITVVALLVTGIIVAYKQSETFRNIVNGAFRAVATAASFMWNDVIKPAFIALTNAWLNVASGIVNGAARAFGWVPGLGGKLKDAADKFNDFKAHVNSQLDGIKDKNVKVTYEAVTIGFGRYEGKQLPPQRSATGGPIFGPGTGTSDSIPALLSNGEHVITAREVRAAGGHRNVESWRKGLLRRAVGGAVDVRFREGESGWDVLQDHIAAAGQGLAASLGGPLRRALEWAGSQAGKPYIWGGVGPAGYDCSGFMSAIANVVLGQNPYSRRFATGSMVGGGVGGFARGDSGGFRIGVMHGNPGHTAGTILGVNVESRGGEGVVIGPRARGASNGLFSSIYHLAGFARGGRVRDGDAPFDLFRGSGIDPRDLLKVLSFDRGGFLPPGLSVAYNGTGRPEPVSPAGSFAEALSGMRWRLDIDPQGLAYVVAEGSRLNARLA